MVIPRYAITRCETDHYILVIFVVISKKEESMYRRKLHIPIILDQISTSQTVLKRSNNIASITNTDYIVVSKNTTSAPQDATSARPIQASSLSITAMNAIKSSTERSLLVLTSNRATYQASSNERKSIDCDAIRESNINTSAEVYSR